METKKEAKSWACLVFSGPKLKIDWVSHKLGMDPDFFLDRDTLTSENEPSIPHWQLNSKLSAKEPLQNHLWELLKRIAAVRNEVKEVSDICDVCFYTSAEFSSPETKGILLDKRLLLLLGDLGINLEILPWDSRRL